MKKIILSVCIVLICNINYSSSTVPEEQTGASYNVVLVKKPVKIDADWDKPVWKKVKPVLISNYMGSLPEFKPEAEVKMMYDNENIYLIFRVKDRNVRCITNTINGPVYKDSAVEFFFSPDSDLPLLYFNLETNCGGTPLLHYNVIPRKESKRLQENEIKMIEIAHSLPEIIDPEIKEQVTWTLEYKIPFSLLEKYSKVSRPAKGVVWKANFYKIAENSSNPHYITWSRIDKPKPDFHVPQSFGKLVFE
ncbi:MAG TPA: carbohydrate-binding family 9-like protein [Bacteroidales bacterium]|nr:carbohydrate-binding family 9-like protein [Bacteroidales bacterium]